MPSKFLACPQSHDASSQSVRLAYVQHDRHRIQSRQRTRLWQGVLRDLYSKSQTGSRKVLVQTIFLIQLNSVQGRKLGKNRAHVLRGFGVGCRVRMLVPERQKRRSQRSLSPTALVWCCLVSVSARDLRALDHLQSQFDVLFSRPLSFEAIVVASSSCAIPLPVLLLNTCNTTQKLLCSFPHLWHSAS